MKHLSGKNRNIVFAQHRPAHSLRKEYRFSGMPVLGVPGSILLFASGMILTVFMLAGCGKMNFGVAVNEDMNISIIAENAPKDTFGAAGSLTVGEKGRILVEPDFEGDSEVNVIFTDGSALTGNASVKELTDAVDQSNAVLEITIGGTEPVEYDLAPGDYIVRATVVKKANGSATISGR